MSFENATLPNVIKKLPTPTPTRTAEFPRGLISDYIKLVDQLTLNPRKA